MYRTTDPDIISEAVSMYDDEVVGFDPEGWIKDDRHIALTDGQGNVNLLEYIKDGVYTGHVFYTTRGKDALDLLSKTIEQVFKEYPVRVIVGLTPEKKRGARWISRRVGFTSHGLIDTIIGPCELFIMTKETR